MSPLNTHRRKVAASVTLACWLFALFVGVVHACGLDELNHAQSSVAALTVDPDGGDDHALPPCERFCADSFPVLAKVQSANDQPYVQTLLLPALLSLRTAANAPSALYTQHQRPRIALNTLFVRLAL